MANLASASSNSGPAYTETQMQEYFNRISLPQEWRNHRICTEQRLPGKLSDPQALQFLQVLQTHQISSTPFENLHLHYSSRRAVKIDPESVFQKIVTDNGRGGYCMENNTLFWVVLRTLGYSVCPTGGRVNTAVRPNGEPGKERRYLGWNHMINIVTIDDVQYLVDVGFGTNGPHHPISLSEKHSRCKSQLHRVRRGPIPEITAKEEDLYIYEFSVQPASTPAEEIDWVPAYCFTTTAFIPADFQMMNYNTSTSPTSFFTTNVLCVKISLKNGHLAGDVSLFDNVVKHRHVQNGKLVTVKTLILGSEKERIEALKDMGVLLTDKERDAIRGRDSEILSPIQRMRSLSFEV